MSYENREIPEGINVSDTHPLKEFVWLLLAAAGIIISAILILSYMAESLVRYVPFETERSIAATLEQQYTDSVPLDLTSAQQKTQAYLQTLSNTLAAHQKLPEGMVITVHYIDDDTVNAFATIGGHIVIFAGLLKKVPHENALSMVLAHEIAHIKHRDPLVSIGRGLTVFLAMSSIAGISNNTIAGQFLEQTGLLTSLSFSRQQEAAADKEAFQTLQSYYGHLEGAADLFEVLKQAEGGHKTFSFFRSHPLTEERIKAIDAFARSVQPDALPEMVPLPEFIRQVSDGSKSHDVIGEGENN